MLIHEAEKTKIQLQYEEAVNKNNELIQQLERVLEKPTQLIGGSMLKKFLMGRIWDIILTYMQEKTKWMQESEMKTKEMQTKFNDEMKKLKNGKLSNSSKVNSC